MLDSLLFPLSIDDFVATKLGREPLRHTVPETFGSISLLPELQSARSLVESARGPFYCWRPENWIPRRSPVFGEEAIEEYDAGCSLYFTKVELGVPQLARACRTIERELGIPPGSVSVQAFASRSGHGVDLHYDHDENLNLQLTGRKAWQLGPNRLVRNPLEGAFWGPSFLRDQGLEPDLEPPLAELESFETAPASLVYVPRGFWHATRCLDDSVAVSFAIQPPYVFQMILAAVQKRLVEDPRARAFAVGVTRPGLPANPEISGVLEPLLGHLAALVPEDCQLLDAGVPRAAQPSFVGGRFRASPSVVVPAISDIGGLDQAADHREIARSDGRPPISVCARYSALVCDLLRRDDLVADRRFARDHSVTAAELDQLLAELVVVGALERIDLGGA